MGGFMLFDGDDLVRTLEPEEIQQLSQNGEIDFPRITEKGEIGCEFRLMHVGPK
jgi:hypothetical protein